ncbi:CAAX amino protease [Virgisporangium aliadipatigenens]|uniref:CAAX amino protease n=2 Tax=Virgisporangium aliadipatigenens TaxID=741659 RepID=A0A8J3YPN1_9ACTN|nr:CAAX amino protease [Virgisporangium aliadipatigenens]
MTIGGAVIHSVSSMRFLKQFAVIVPLFLVGNVTIAAVSGTFLPLFLGPAFAVAGVAAYRWIVRRTEHRDVTELARDGARPALRRGALLGVGLFSLVIAVIALFGGYSVEGYGSLWSALAVTGGMACAATMEELAFRGLLFRTLEERFGTYRSMAVSGALFGLLHLVNSGATLRGAIAIAFQAGLMLAAVYAATRSLWLPIGIHFGWNVAQGAIFGTTVSGAEDARKGLLDGVLDGPAALTGGGFGPEGSVLSVLVGLAVTVVFLRIAKRRGNVVPARRRATTTLPA